MKSISRLSKGHYMNGGVVFLLVVALIVGMAACTQVTPPPPGPEEIWDWDDLNGIRDDMHGNYILMANLDSASEGWDTLVNNGDGWLPIGNSTARFTGTFDGNWFTIKDLHIYRPNEDNVGLFGYVGEGGAIKNIGVEATIEGRKNVGALVGSIYKGTVDSEVTPSSPFFTNSSGSVTGLDSVGGLVGYNWGGTVSISWSSATVSSGGPWRAGGLVGHNSFFGVIANCVYREGEVTGLYQVGGLVGLNAGEVRSCKATGNVTGDRMVGGVAGVNLRWGGLNGSSFRGNVNGEYYEGLASDEGTISSPLSAEAATDPSYIGGLVGWNEGEVDGCSADSDVLGAQYVGGLVGWNDGERTLSADYDAHVASLIGYRPVSGLSEDSLAGTIRNSYSMGSVTGVEYVGGLVGGNDGDVGSCFSTGKVDGLDHVGGLVGWNDGNVADSFWDRDASGTTIGIGRDTGESTNITGVSTAELKDINTYSEQGWDICAVARGEINTACTWNIVDGEGYPFLSGKERELPPEPQKVTIAAIPGVTAPATGATPKMTTAPTAQYTGTISWSPAHSPYQAETVYVATITLTAREGYTLEGVAADFFTVAGATRTSNAANSGAVTAVFPATVKPKYTPMVAAGGVHTVGLRADGTVVAVGDTGWGRCDVGGWTGIVEVAAGGVHTVGLRSDGTVVAVGWNEYGQCDVGGWMDIVSVAAGCCHTVGLRADGTVVAVGHNDWGQCDVGGWTDIVQVSGDAWYTVGLKSDGTVVAVGWNEYGQRDVGGWTGIVEVAAGGGHTVGLRADGRVVAVGWNEYGQCDVGGWTGIVEVAAGGGHTVGLRADGMVVAVGFNDDGQCEVGKWTGIVQLATGGGHTVGLKSDGTVVAVGHCDFGQCDVGGWNLAP